MTIDGPRMPLGEFSSSKMNKLVNTYGKPTKRATSTALPSIKSLIDCTAPVSVPVINKVGPVKDRFSREETDEITKKLRIRLQFAYFKLKTNQTSLKFEDLRRQSEKQIPKQSRQTLKRRKLLVGHGNLKTPAKSIIHQHTLAKISSTNVGTEGTDNDEKSPQNFLKFYHNTTPLGKSSLNPQQCQKQETPMSVKAAKSLLHLFTSSQH